MIKIAFNILIIGIILSFTSCCTKKECVFDNLNEIELYNFSENEVDSINVEIFNKNSNFTNRIDSSFISSNYKSIEDSTLIISLSKKINMDYDYKFTLISTGKVYKLTDFITKKKECNCIFDRVNVLDNYSVNGQKQNISTLKIKK